MLLRKIGLNGIVALTLLSVPLFAGAQQSGTRARIGVLKREAGPDARDEAFRQGLRDLGWIEGQNISIEYRWAAFKMDRIPALAEELVRLKVDVIVTATQRVTHAAKKATRTIPIVMMWAADAVENGLVDSLARPGGNITGLSEDFSETNAKLLEVLHDTLPEVTRVAFLWDPDNRNYARTFKFVQPVAPSLGLTLQSLALRRGEKAAEELESILAAAAREQAGALVVMGRLYGAHGRTIEEFSAKHRVPVFSISTGRVEKYSGLLAYAPDWTDLARRAATYVDKVLKGAKPADLPVQRPVKFKLVVNMKTAKQLGLTIPPEVLYRADKAIR